MAKPKSRIDAIIDAVNRGFKGGAKRLSEGADSDVTEVIPFGVSVLDRYVLGVGGLACGRVSELFSEEGAGKTSLLLAALGQAQSMGGIGVLIETEHALDSPRAKVFGINQDDVVLIQPDHIMDAGHKLELVLGALNGAGPVLVGWDSVAATMSKEEAEHGLPDKDSFDKRAKDFSQVMRVINPLLPKARAHLCLVNQVRANIGVMFGDKFVTPCGKAIKFHSSVRLQIFGGKAQKDAAGQHLGKDVTVMSMKNKVCRPFRKARVRLNYETGFDDDWSTLNHAKEMKLVDPRSRDVAAARAALDAADWWRVGAAAGVTPEVDDQDDHPDEDEV